MRTDSSSPHPTYRLYRRLETQPSERCFDRAVESNSLLSDHFLELLSSVHEADVRFVIFWWSRLVATLKKGGAASDIDSANSWVERSFATYTD